MAKDWSWILYAGLAAAGIYLIYKIGNPVKQTAEDIGGAIGGFATTAGSTASDLLENAASPVETALQGVQGAEKTVFDSLKGLLVDTPEYLGEKFADLFQSAPKAVMSIPTAAFNFKAANIARVPTILSPQVKGSGAALASKLVAANTRAGYTGGQIYQSHPTNPYGH